MGIKAGFIYGSLLVIFVVGWNLAVFSLILGGDTKKLLMSSRFARVGCIAALIFLAISWILAVILFITLLPLHWAGMSRLDWVMAACSSALLLTSALSLWQLSQKLPKKRSSEQQERALVTTFIVLTLSFMGLIFLQFLFRYSPIA